MSEKLLETFTQCLAEAQSDSREAQRKALRTLASLTKVSPPNRNLLAQIGGAIATLVGLSRSSSSTVQTLSLCILFNLSLNNNLKHVLADMETIYHLNSIILAPTSPESGKFAASLICSLSMLNKNKARFGVTGTIQALVKVLGEPRCPASHHLLSSLSELVQFHGNCTLAVWAGVVPVLIQIVESNDSEDLAGSALAIMGLLARYEEGMNEIRDKEGVVSLLVDVLGRRCMLSKEGAADVLLRLFDESEGCMRDAARLPEFSSMLADISVRGSAMAREKAIQLMKKMMDADLDTYLEPDPEYYHW
ncbi:hypothetical protein IFM89_009818 [Coptis chinensis]|uniref:U-box domain-containing protein n=1 Tax=Coptis chinensis TaxID=261450 RepID=A0A835LXB3_9MAGN|nr:hypothetical protein IFM89_009818 [Coptis chinensis]